MWNQIIETGKIFNQNSPLLHEMLTLLVVAFGPDLKQKINTNNKIREFNCI
jgi:hypothetical protein